jgi:quercetin dioxygenase-like cupin family protein
MDGDGTPPRSRPRPTPRQLAYVCAAFVLGGVMAILVDRALDDTGPMRAQETVAEAPVGTLEEVPVPPVKVLADRVRLPQGFESRRYHGGPTFTFVDLGRIEVEIDGETVAYGAGAFFFVEAGQVYTLRVPDTAGLATVRLLEPGAEATTEVD